MSGIISKFKALYGDMLKQADIGVYELNIDGSNNIVTDDKVINVGDYGFSIRVGNIVKLYKFMAMNYMLLSLNSGNRIIVQALDEESDAVEKYAVVLRTNTIEVYNDDLEVEATYEINNNCANLNLEMQGSILKIKLKYPRDTMKLEYNTKTRKFKNVK